jgi:tricorn protease-like protein
MLALVVAALMFATLVVAADDDPVADLVKALGDDNALIRKRAAVALQRLGPAARPAVPALQKALIDKDPEVRTAAAAALRAIGGPMSREELIHRLKDRDQPANLRVAACKELVDRFGGEPAVVQALESVLADPAVKLAAAQALEAFDKRRKLDRITGGVTLKGHNAPVKCLAFSPDCGTLVTAGGELGKAGEIKFWDTATARDRLSLKGHGEMVNALAFSSDGKWLASGGGVYDHKQEKWTDGEIKLWDAANGEEVVCFTAHSRPVTSLAFSGDGKILVSVSEDKTVYLWDVVKRQEMGHWKALPSAVLSVAVSSDGKTMAAGCADKKIRLFDLPDGKERHVLKGHAGPVLCLAFTTDGKTLVSGGGVYDVDMQTWLSGEAKVWDVATGTERASFKKHTDAVAAIALSPDGQTLATGSWDTSVKVWDIATKQERTSLPAHTSRVTGVAFSPDGKQLATASADRTAKLWKVVWEKQ